jgi:F0F1-type ATP synthase membrane subunit b/b'
MVKELQERAANLAIATATEIITSKLDEKASLELVDTAVNEIEKLN